MLRNEERCGLDRAFSAATAALAQFLFVFVVLAI